MGNSLRLRPGSVLLGICLALATSGCNEVRRALGLSDVELRVSDDSCASATVRWGDGGTNDTELVVDLPWSRDLGTASGLQLIVVARRECDDDGTIKVEIRLDGDLEDSGTAAGPQAVASASTSFL